MPKKELFLQALRDMNTIMKQDIRDGNQWKYCNSTKKKEKNFAAARKKGKFLINCVDGVQWACKIAGIPAYALSWYGQKGSGIAWCSKGAEANARKEFEIIKIGDRTVKQLLDENRLCEGDILTYIAISHTNVYMGDEKSFDSGHAYCTPKSGEGAKFSKWIGSLTCRNNTVGYIFRIRDRYHYRVQAGAYLKLEKANEQVAILAQHGFKAIIKEEDGMFIVQAGYFSGKETSQRRADEIAGHGIAVFIKEV